MCTLLPFVLIILPCYSSRCRFKYIVIYLPHIYFRYFITCTNFTRLVFFRYYYVIILCCLLYCIFILVVFLFILRLLFCRYLHYHFPYCLRIDYFSSTFVCKMHKIKITKKRSLQCEAYHSKTMQN